MKKHKMKQIVSLALAAVMVGSVLAGCGNNNVPNNAANETPTETLKILYTGTPEIHEKEYIVDSYFKNFEDKYGVNVEVEFLVHDDAIAKISSEQETGKIVTDVVYTDTAHIAPYVNGGWMQDVTDLVEKAGVTYTDMFDKVTNKDGVRYFVPNSFDVYITIANRDALEYLPEGLTEDDFASGITWEQYAEWAVNIAEGEGVGKTMFPASMDGSQLLYPMGGMSLAYGGAFPELSSAGFQNALGIIAKMAEGDAFYSEQDQYTAPTDPLSSGDVWLTFAHMSPVGTAYNAAPNEYVIGPAPTGSEGKGSTSGAFCYGIQEGAPNQSAAEKLIEYITTPEVNYDFCSTMGFLSPMEEVGDILSSDEVVMQAGIEMLNNTIISGVPSTEYSDWNAVKLLFGDVFNKVLTDKAVPAKDYLDGMQSQLEALKIAE